ncbi:MAG TPA: sulfite exporter TauE/SafE family protein [Acidimicrobiia bacterium]|nr:sulfite exporter TauE/SafE family protein [Acidimicrobiia bacterium]
MQSSAPLVVKAWKLALIGVAAGLLSGGFGVGGGIIMVPLLVAVGLDRHRAHATSLAAIIPIAVAGAVAFGLSGEISLGLGIYVGLGGVVGSVLGASLMNRMSSRSLSIFFGVVLLAAGIRMIASGDSLPGSSDFDDPTQIAIAIAIGLVSGFFAGVAGIGGGAVIVPATVLLLGFTQHEAQGTSLVAIILTAIAGSVVNLRNRRVRPRDGLVAGGVGVVGSIVGAQIALGVDGRALSVMFGALVVVLSARTLYQAIRTPETVV